MTPGRIIAIEGGDAVGKKTQSELLHKRLAREAEAAGAIQPRLYSFPRYGTPLGQAIFRHLTKETCLAQLPKGDWGHSMRAPEDAMVFQCMMTVDKYHAAAEFEPLWFQGADLVFDRWYQSAVVFGTVDGVDPQWLLDIHTNLPKADLNILLDLPTAEAIARRPAARDRYEENAEHRSAVRSEYRKLWHLMADAEGPFMGSWVVVDASQSVEKIHETIWALASVLKPMHNPGKHTEHAEGRGS